MRRSFVAWFACTASIGFVASVGAWQLSSEGMARHAGACVQREEEGSQYVREWSDLNDSLEVALARAGKRADDAAVAASLLAALPVEKDPVLLFAMLEQGDYPLVQLAGFYAMIEARPESAGCAALLVLSVSQEPAFGLFGPVYEAVSEGHGEFGPLGNAPIRGRIDEENLAIIAHALPVSSLKEWIDERSAIPIPIDLYALALDRLFAEGELVAAEWEDRLRTLRAIPGMPRYVYLLHTTNKGKETDLVMHELQQAELSTLHFAVLARRYRDDVAFDVLRKTVSQDKQAVLNEIEN